jgi:hypothetical protein
MGIVLVNCAVAGEKFKGRTVWYTIKWEPINAPGEEKHFLAVAESKGISSNTQGKAFGEGTVERSVGVYDFDLKTEGGSQNGYQESTDRDEVDAIASATHIPLDGSRSRETGRSSVPGI